MLVAVAHLYYTRIGESEINKTIQRSHRSIKKMKKDESAQNQIVHGIIQE